MAEQRGSQPGQLRVGDRAEVEPGHMTRVCGGSSPPPREASENYAGVTLFAHRNVGSGEITYKT
jgi:hypothetical protein